VNVGAQWLSRQNSLVLCVPSVIVPEESIALINPAHPMATRLTAHKLRPVTYGGVFRNALQK
jgi:RES domain-containing protein